MSQTVEIIVDPNIIEVEVTTLGEQGIQGEQGFNGWQQETEIEIVQVSGVDKAVRKLVGYFGGTGEEPTENVGKYEGVGGWVDTPAEAFDYINEVSETALSLKADKADIQSNIDIVFADLTTSTTYTNLLLANKTNVPFQYKNPTTVVNGFLTFNSSGVATLPVTAVAGFVATIFGATGVLSNYYTKTQIKAIVPDYMLNIPSIVEGGNLIQPRNIATTQNITLYPVTDVALTSRQINSIKTGDLTGGNIETYLYMTETDSSEVINLFNANKGKYLKLRWYIYSRDGIAPGEGLVGRLGLSWSGSPNGNFGIIGRALTSLSPTSWRLDQVVQIPLSMPNIIGLTVATTWLSDKVALMTHKSAGDNGINGFSFWLADSPSVLTDDNVSEDWQSGTVDPNKLVSGKMADEKYLSKTDASTTYATKTSLEVISNKFKNISAVTGGNLSSIKTVSLPNYKTLTDGYLNPIGVTELGYTDRSGNVENYVVFDTDFRNKYLQNNGKWIKIRLHGYTKNGTYTPGTGGSGRLGIVGTTNTVSFNAGNVTYTYKTANVFEITAIFLINQITLPATFWFSVVWENALIPVGFVNGDFGVTAIGAWFADTQSELTNDNKLQYDWIADPNSALTVGEGDSRYAKKGVITNTFNNIFYNRAALAPFLTNYLQKNVDAFNRLPISLNGDSIFGRVDKSSFTPETAEISLTPDTNNPSETLAGYVTGHFPPNMWEQVVAYKLLKALQYDTADVKYYNHVASEIVKSGTWVNSFPFGADCLRIATSSVLGSAMVLTFTGATIAKFIYTCYTISSTFRNIRLSVSIDGGSSYVTPASLGLIESYPSDGVGSGTYTLPATEYKWGNIMLKGFNPSTTYKLKLELLQNSPIGVWGFETWSNPRIDVIVAAEGGNIALNQFNAPQRFYDDMYGQKLNIYELPYLNDLGGNINNYGGLASLSTTPIGSPTVNYFYYANVTGTYTNFGVTATKGQYIEWSGSVWRVGQTALNTAIASYLTDNRAVFTRLKSAGIPVLTLITHTSTSFATKPYTQQYGLILLRHLVKEFGFACIDINEYQKLYGLSKVYSDGTHLNDNGVEMYRSQIMDVLNPLSDFEVFSHSEFRVNPYIGNSNLTTVSFGFTFSSIPRIRLYNTTRTVLTITKKGFTVSSGSDTYEWEAIL